MKAGVGRGQSGYRMGKGGQGKTFPLILLAEAAKAKAHNGEAREKERRKERMKETEKERKQGESIKGIKKNVSF